MVSLLMRTIESIADMVLSLMLTQEDSRRVTYSATPGIRPTQHRTSAAVSDVLSDAVSDAVSERYHSDPISDDTIAWDQMTLAAVRSDAHLEILSKALALLCYNLS